MVPNGWEISTLNDAGIVVIDGDRGKEYPKSTEFSDSGYCVFLSAKNVSKRGFLFEQVSFISQERHSRLRKGQVKRNNIILTTRGTVGQFAYYDNSVPYNVVRINSGMVILDTDKSMLQSDFFYWLCRSHIVGKQIEAASFGSAQPQLTVSIIKKLQLPIPPLEEQQKIAQILSTWDKAIAVTEQLLANSQQQKKALMQQLLTGKKRLLDENGARFEGEWEEFSLGNIAKVYQPKTISQSQLSFDGYPVYGANGIIGYYCDFNHELEQIAVTCRGSTCGVVNWTMPKSWITGNAMVINVDNNSSISKKFLFYVLSNADLKYLITGSGQPQITGDIKNHVVHLASFKEQKVIAEVLTIADQEIKALQRKIDCLQQEKKALMQQLLTGKRRVKVTA